MRITITALLVALSFCAFAQSNIAVRNLTVTGTTTLVVPYRATSTDTFLYLYNGILYRGIAPAGSGGGGGTTYTAGAGLGLSGSQFYADSTKQASVKRLKDTAAALRAAIGSGGTTDTQKLQTFIATASQAVFTTSFPIPTDSAKRIVTRNGATIFNSQYTVSGSTLTLATPSTAGDIISVRALAAGTTIGGSGPVTATFSASLPYTADYTFMNAGTLTSATYFTPLSTGRIQGGGVYVRWISDSVHVPTFDTALNVTGSVDRTTGMVNRLISIWNGFEYETNLTQLGIYSNAPPVQSSAAVANSTPSVVDITFTKSLASGYVPLASDFSVSGHTTTGTVTLTGSVVHVPVTVAFTSSEAARTVTYTPGLTANKLQDNNGNLVSAFTGLAITNNVLPPDTVPPTLVSAIVSNSTPGRINLTWSEAMNSTLSATSAFAVSAGHTLTGTHTYVDATHSYLTTSTDFTGGEAARTLSYTQPGSNKMKDLAGNLLINIPSSPITNNVSDDLLFTTRSAELTNTGTVFNSTNTSDFYARGVDSLRLPLNGDGLIYMTVANLAKDAILGFDASTTTIPYTSLDWGVFASQDYIVPIIGGTIGSASATRILLNDKLGIRRTSGIYTIELNHSGTWSVIFTLNTGSPDNAVKAPHLIILNRATDPKHIGLQ